jgi:hypothetical protein
MTAEVADLLDHLTDLIVDGQGHTPQADAVRDQIERAEETVRMQ